MVQAWRFGDEHPDTWEPGVYSVVRFAVAPIKGGTRLTIDHDGIPVEWEEHIRDGYPAFYADPIRKHFAAS
ncbi:MAG TPA: SRPBCC domain-containing protein [Solirubrobacterales bacterium]